MKRKDCPKCGRTKSVRLLEKDGQSIEHCFGVDCKYYKTDKKELELQDIINKNKKTFDKELLLDGRSHRQTWEYIQKWRCSQALTNIYYNPYDTRIVFNYRDLYVGRSTSSIVSPKWYVYTDIEYPFVVQKSSKKTSSVLLVEDIISACVASNLIDSIALLGTNLHETYLTEFLKYDKIYIALDEDATTKALKIYQILSLVRDCKVIPLKKDIKYLTIEEIEQLLNEPDRT